MFFIFIYFDADFIVLYLKVRWFAYPGSMGAEREPDGLTVSESAKH